VIAALVAAAALGAVPDQLGEWEVLADGDIRVACAPAGEFTWCRAQAQLEAPLERIEAVLLDVGSYPDVFKRITQATEVAPNTVHIVLDMPFPIASRDYVARFTRAVEGQERVFAWVADDQVDVPVGKAVRLVHAGGEWRLAEASAEVTEVSYTWNGDLGGDFPTWALPRAWRVQGLEVLEWLDDAVR